MHVIALPNSHRFAGAHFHNPFSDFEIDDRAVAKVFDEIHTCPDPRVGEEQLPFELVKRGSTAPPPKEKRATPRR